LSDSLGNSVRISPVEAEYDSEIFHTSIRPVRRDSWHAGWGLPRPTLSGLAAGSVAAFKVAGLGRKKDMDKVELLMRKLEATGIGDRRAEGFGQLCFNHFFTTKKLFMIPAAASIYNRRPRTIRAGGEIAEGDQQSELFDLLGRAALSNEIRKKAMEVASDADKCKEHLGFEIEKGKSRPTLSRIGLFRMLLQHVEAIPEKGCTADENDPHEDKSVAVKWFEHARKKDEKKKWEGSPSEKLKKLVCGNNNDDIWSVLGINLFQFGVGNEDDEIIRKEFAPEAVRVFFDACARAHKREYERMKKGGNTGGNDSSESGQKEQDDGA
jgi:CRISPR-associated protein Csx10